LNTDFINYLKKFNTSKLNAFFTYSFIFLLVLLVALLSFNSLNSNFELTKDRIKINTCNSYIFDEKIEGYDRETSINQEISIFPEIENITCLGGVIGYQIIDGEDNEITLYRASSSRAYKFLTNLFNFSLCIYVLLINKSKTKNFIFFYLTINFLILNIFYPTESITKIILPTLYPEGIINPIFFQNIAIMLISMKVNNNKLTVLSIIYFVFFSIDFLGIYFILFFINSNFENKFTKKENMVLASLPIFFYSLRIFSSINKGLDHIWINLGQRVFRGYRRFPDFEALMVGYKCNTDSATKFVTGGTVLDCSINSLRMGPSGELLKFNGSIKLTSLILGIVSIFLLTILYVLALKIFNNKTLLLLVFFLSPPLNFATFLGNVDIYIALIGVAIIFIPKFQDFISGIILFLLSLFKLHPIGGLIGLFISTLIKKSKKLSLFLFALISIFIWMLISYSYESKLELVYFDTIGLSYGLLNQSLILGENFGTPNLFNYFILLIISFTIYKLLNFSRIEIENIKNIYMPQSLFLIYGIWFLETVFYTNSTYRLAIFLYFFFIIYLHVDSKTKLVLLLLLLLEPTILLNFKVYEIFFGIINSLSLLIIFFIIADSIIFFLKTKIKPKV
tara:strand:+ start:2937 stop:4799 length:1863 start_codon:yes stop_codon:yes gene_type:complete